MSQIVNISDLASNAEANAFAALLNGGTLNFYSGIQPANANTALSGNTLLATLIFANPAFGAAAGGVITANAIAPGTAVASGTATFARALNSSGQAIADFAVGVGSGYPILLNSTAIVQGVNVAVTSTTYQVTET